MKGNKNELKIFEFESMKVRVVVLENEPWWVLKDICDVLELTNPTVVADRLDSDEVTKFNLGGLSGESNLVNESGLYSVIMRSDKPEAKKFRKWVTSEVLPTIRKTGSYVTPEDREKLDAQKRRADAMWTNAKARLAKELRETLNQYQDRLSSVSIDACVGEIFYLSTGSRFLPPKVEKTYSASDLASDFSVSANRIGRIASKHDLRNEDNGFWILDTAPGGKQVQNFRYSEHGRQVVRGLLVEEGYFASDEVEINVSEDDEDS